MEDLADSEEFPELDVELADAVCKIAQGELGRAINARVDSQQKQGILPCGRQLLLMVYNDNRTNEEAGQIYDILDLTKVQWLGDNKMETFQLNFETVLRGAKEISETQIKVCYLEQLMKSGRLKQDVAAFRRMRNDDPDKNYEWLRLALMRQVELDKLDANRKAQEAALGAPDPAHAAKGGGRGGKKGGKGKDDKPPKKGDKPKGKGKKGDGKTKGKKDGDKSGSASRESSPGAVSTSSQNSTLSSGSDGKKACWFWHKGACTKGDQCEFYHDPAKAPSKEQIAAAKAKAKEKAKGKGGAKDH